MREELRKMDEDQRAAVRARLDKEKQQIELDYAKDKMNLLEQHEQELAQLPAN